MLKFTKKSGPDDYSGLVGSKTPVPLLIRVPDSNMVHFVTGLAPFIGGPLQCQSPLHGSFLAIQQDIDDPSDMPQVLALPHDIIKVHKIQAWTHEAMKVELEKERANPNTPWCREQKVKTSFVEIAKSVPCPPDLVWGAFHNKVPAHIVLESILSIKDSCTAALNKDLLAYLKDFLSAAQVTHNKNSPNLDLSSRTFTRPLPCEAKLWGKDQMTALFGSASAASSTPQRGTAPSQASSPKSIAAFTTALLQFVATHGTATATATTPDPATDTFKKYGMSVLDLEHTLTLCSFQLDLKISSLAGFNELQP